MFALSVFSQQLWCRSCVEALWPPCGRWVYGSMMFFNRGHWHCGHFAGVGGFLPLFCCRSFPPSLAPVAHTPHGVCVCVCSQGYNAFVTVFYVISAVVLVSLGLTVWIAVVLKKDDNAGVWTKRCVRGCGVVEIERHKRTTAQGDINGRNEGRRFWGGLFLSEPTARPVQVCVSPAAFLRGLPASLPPRGTSIQQPVAVCWACRHWKREGKLTLTDHCCCCQCCHALTPPLPPHTHTGSYGCFRWLASLCFQSSGLPSW